MANPALLHLPLREGLTGRDRAGVVTATATGPVRFTDDGYYAEEATTNALSNPSFETNTSGWSIAGAGSTITRVTTQSMQGSAALEVVCPGSVAFEGCASTTNVIAATVGQAWTASVYLKGTGTVVLGISEYDAANVFVTQGFTSQVVLTDQWQRVTLSRTLSGATTAFVSIRVITPTVQAITFYADAAQLEQKDYVTSYCDGSLGTGYSWSGAAHASASTRAAAYLTISATYLNETSGAVILRAVAQNYAKSRGLLDVGVGDWRLYGLLTTAAAVTVEVGASSLADNDGLTPGTVDRIYADWLAGSPLHLQVDDQATVTSGGNLASGGTIAGTDAYIGRTAGASYLNGYISDLMIFDRPLTGAERTRLASLDEWSFDTLGDGGAMLLGTRTPVLLTHPGAGLSSRFIEIGGSVR